jgi:hypothetical protein
LSHTQLGGTLSSSRAVIFIGRAFYPGYPGPRACH